VDDLTSLLKRGSLLSRLEAIMIIIRFISGKRKGRERAFVIPSARKAFGTERINIGIRLSRYLREGCDWVVESVSGKKGLAKAELSLWTQFEDQIRHEYDNDPLRALYGSPLDGRVVICA
jgi:hypothetical protein